MSYLNIRFSKKEPYYLTVFLPILLVAYSITLSSANAVEVFRMDDGIGFSKMEGMEGFQLPGENQWEPGVLPYEGIPYEGIPHDSSQGFEIEEGKIVRRSSGSSPIFKPGYTYVEPEWVLMDPPQRVSTVTYMDSSTGEEVTKAWSQLENAEILEFITNTDSETTVGKLDAFGNVNYAIANATGKKGNYRIIIDDILYRAEEATNKSGLRLGDGKIGIGLRLTANITTYEANIDLRNLPALSLAARANKLDGHMKVEIIGIRTRNSNELMLSSTEINDTSISNAVRTLAILKSKIPNSDTHLDPQVLWVKPSPYYIKPEDKKNEQSITKLFIERIIDFLTWS